MPATAFALALGAACLHAFWNLLLARARDTEAATAVALLASVVVFAPVALLAWDIDGRVWPFVAGTSLLQLLYFVLLATAYRRAELSFVYPIARGLAPVLVLLVGVLALRAGASPAQVGGVCLVAAGVVLVRGLRGPSDARDLALALAIAACIAAYTVVDKYGVRYADPVVYLELGMVPAALAFAALAVRERRASRLRAELSGATVVAGIAAFAAYVLVLAALQRASAASVAAVRETSVVIAAVLAAPVLGEPVGRARVGGAALVVAGIALLAVD